MPAVHSWQKSSKMIVLRPVFSTYYTTLNIHMTFFDDAVEKRKLLQASFAILPTMTLLGVVGPQGASGGKIPPETQWSLNVGLIAWRMADGLLRETSLILTKLVSDEELCALQGAIRANSVIAFEAKLCESSPFGDARAELVRLLDAHTAQADPELERVLACSVAPVETSDPVLGRLVLNKAVDWFEGQVTWLGKTIDVALSADGEIDPQAALKAAKVLLGSMAEWSRKIEHFAVSELLDLKNECWLAEGEQEISATEFLTRMQLTSMTVYPDGSFEFWHEDGDLFWGHSILVSGSISLGVTDASIAG